MFGRYEDGPIFTTDGQTTRLKVTVPAGSYVILGKVTAAAGNVEYECRTIAGGNFDRAVMGTISSQGVLTRETVTMTVLHSSRRRFSARIVCADGDPGQAFQLRDLKVTAIKVPGISNRAG